MFEIKKDNRFDTTEKLLWNILTKLESIEKLMKENKPSVKEDENKCLTNTVKKDTKGRKR
jgi:hypothetical protein